MEPDQTLILIYDEINQNFDQSYIDNPEILKNIELVSKNLNNRAGARMLLACSLAKVHDEALDIRKPYTEIGDSDAFSGRSYDERYIGPFITEFELPCNSTTAFLTPALRNQNMTLTPDMNLSGRPKIVYKALLQLLTEVYKGTITAQQLLSETLRQLVMLRDETRQRRESLLRQLRLSRSDVSISAEQIVTILEQHLVTRGASRLPVLIVAAAYAVIGKYLPEKVIPLEAHNAADSQTKALGDVQVTLQSDDNIVTCYEMKMKQVTKNDVDIAINEKLLQTSYRVDNYIFITTDNIIPEVTDYAKAQYAEIGIEIVILDCITFSRYFLHLFHRYRVQFLDEYQELVLSEPDSAVSAPVKEVFLVLRQAAESE